MLGGHYEEALRYEPESLNALKGLGRVFLKQRRYEDAEQIYRESLRIQPSDAECLNNLGVLLRVTGREQDAALAFKAALLADPTLELHKSNTKRTVQEYLSRGTVTVNQLLILFGLMSGVSLLTNDATFRGSTLLTFAGLLATAAVQRLFRMWKVSKLKKADPELLKIYALLQKDETVS